MNQNWEKVEYRVCQLQTKVVLELFLKLGGTPNHLLKIPQLWGNIYIFKVALLFYMIKEAIHVYWKNRKMHPHKPKKDNQ